MSDAVSLAKIISNISDETSYPVETLKDDEYNVLVIFKFDSRVIL